MGPWGPGAPTYSLEKFFFDFVKLKVLGDGRYADFFVPRFAAFYLFVGVYFSEKLILFVVFNDF